MTNDKMISFIKRWRELDRRQQDIDYMRSVWARDVRSECGTDAKFTKWCADELGLTDEQARGLLSRVAVLEVVPDAKEWQQLGGYAKLRALEQVPTKRERVAVIEAAKAGSYAVPTVVRQRQAAQSAARPDIAPPRKPTTGEDALRFATFIVNRIPKGDIPADLKEALLRWVPAGRWARKEAA